MAERTIEKKIFGHGFIPAFPNGLPEDFKPYDEGKLNEETGVVERNFTSEGRRCENSRNDMKRVEDITRELIDIMNRSGEDEVYFGVIRELGKTHRTFQQFFMRHVIMAAIDFFNYEHENHFTDARNEDTCKLAHEIIKLIKEKQIYLPMV